MTRPAQVPARGRTKSNTYEISSHGHQTYAKGSREARHLDPTSFGWPTRPARFTRWRPSHCRGANAAPIVLAKPVRRASGAVIVPRILLPSQIKHRKLTSVMRMVGNILAIIIASLLWGCVSAEPVAIPSPSTCGEFVTAPDDRPTRQATNAFLEHTNGKIRDYKVSREDCGDTFVLFFEGVGAYANVGYHWFIVYVKATGKMRIIDGI